MSEQTVDSVSENEESKKLSLLLLDDEADILKSLTRVLRYDYDVVSFQEGELALEHLVSHPAAIIISDMRMPNMDGAEFLTKARSICPDSVRFLLTGYSDMESTVRSINEGGIHTYLAKPWDNEVLKQTIAQAAEMFQLKQDKQRLTKQIELKNRELKSLNTSLEEKVAKRTEALQRANGKLQTLLNSRNKTFKDILATLSAIIQYSTGQPADHCQRVAEMAKAIACRLELSDAEVTHIYLSGLIHEIGLIKPVSEIQAINIENEIDGLPFVPDCNAELGAEIISQIHRFKPLIGIIRHQDENVNGTGLPDHLAGDDIPIGSRILRVVKNYDFFTTAPNNNKKMTPRSARDFLLKQAGELYDEKVVDEFIKFAEKGMVNTNADVCVGLEEVKVGATLKQDLYLHNGALMLTAGHKLDGATINKLKELEKTSALPITLFV